MTDKTCLNCQVSSKDRPLVVVEINNEEKRVCVKCLPGIIHGSN